LVPEFEVWGIGFRVWGLGTRFQGRRRGEYPQTARYTNRKESEFFIDNLLV